MQHYQRIRDLREDSDLTQEALCKKLYMHKTTYTNYEQGKHTVPLDFAVQLADFYQVSIDYIAGRTNFPQGMPVVAEETDCPKYFSDLTERNKGRVEQFVEQLYEQQQTEFQQKITCISLVFSAGVLHLLLTKLAVKVAASAPPYM